MNLDIQNVIDRLKAEIGNLVVAAAMKDVMIEALQKELNKKESGDGSSGSGDRKD